MRVLIVDQFFGINPYQLQQRPKDFEVLIKECLGQPFPQTIGYRKPEVKEVEENFRPPWCTTVFRAGQDGKAELWKYNWDSSG